MKPENGMTEALSIVTTIMSILSLCVSLVAIVLVLAQKWSTHKIEWKPLQTEMPKEEEGEDNISDEALLEKALLLNKKKKKEIDPLSENETSNF